MRKKVQIAATALAIAFVWLFLFNVLDLEAYAVSGNVLQLDKAVTAYEQKDISSKVIGSFAAGDSIFVVESDEEWIEIFFKGEKAYIPATQINNDAIASAEKSAQEMGEAVAKEIDKYDQDMSIGLDNYLRKQRQKLHSLVWKISLGGLAVAIIALSVIIGIKNSKSERDGSNEVCDSKEEA